jgi:hypothetical protein
VIAKLLCIRIRINRQKGNSRSSLLLTNYSRYSDGHQRKDSGFVPSQTACRVLMFQDPSSSYISLHKYSPAEMAYTCKFLTTVVIGKHGSSLDQRRERAEVATATIFRFRPAELWSCQQQWTSSATHLPHRFRCGLNVGSTKITCSILLPKQKLCTIELIQSCMSEDEHPTSQDMVCHLPQYVHLDQC